LPNIKQPSNAAERIADMDRFSRLLNISHVDKKKLWQKVEAILAQKKTATLKEVVEETGLEYGLAEIVAYFSFLKDKRAQVQILDNITEHIALDEEEFKFIEVPYLLFSH
jgi:hypothetical protein